MNGGRGTDDAHKVSHWMRWGQYVAAAAAYEAVYEIAYHLSYESFLLTTGLRLACMLLLPQRFWLALALGEAVPLVENALFCAHTFGIPWAVLASVPTVLLWWPVLAPIRRRGALVDACGRARMPVILGATLAVSVITATITTASLVAALLHAPGQWSEDPLRYFAAWLLGAYLGALTLTPVLLALHERYRTLAHLPLGVGVVWRSPLWRDTVAWAAPALGLLTVLSLVLPTGGAQQLVRLALLWPVVGLAWRHGWHGAALGGMGASIALAVTAPDAMDLPTMEVQAILALALTTTLWASARSPRSVVDGTTPPGQADHRAMKR